VLFLIEYYPGNLTSSTYRGGAGTYHNVLTVSISQIPGLSYSRKPTRSVSSIHLESPSQPCNTPVSKSPSSSPPPSLSFSASTPTNKGARRHSPAHQAKYHVLLAPPSIHRASNPLWLKNRHAALGSTSARFAYKIPFQPPCTF